MLTQKIKNLSIGARLILSYAVIFALIVIFGAATWYYVKDSLSRRIESELDNMAVTIRDMIMTAADVSIRNHLRAITESNRDIVANLYDRYQSGEMTETAAREAADNFMLSQTIGKTGYLFALNISQAPDNLYSDIHPTVPGKNVAHVDFIQRATAMKNGYIEYDWKNPGEKAPRKKVMYISYFEPWRWVIGATSYVEEFNEIVRIEDFREKIQSIKIGRRGYVYMVNLNGDVLIHPELQDANVIDEKDKYGKKFIREMTDTKNGRIEYTWKNPMEKEASHKIAVYKYIPRFDWIVASSAYHDEILEPMKVVNWIIIALIGVMFVMVLIITPMVNSRIIRPLKKASAAAHSLGNLDLTVDLSTRRRDEVGMLFDAMNEMIRNLREMIGLATDAAGRVNSSAEEILQAVDEQAIVATEQSASISEISSTMEEFSATSAQIAENSNQVVGIADNNLKKLQSGSELVGALTKKMHKISQDNQHNIKEIGNLKKKTDEISKVMGIINSIADQTKLIAFNAAIESASAGEAGKRFGVVAVEIRRLADNVMESTGEIQSRIHEIQAAAGNMVVASETSSKGVQEGMASFARIEDLFRDILESGKTTTNSAKQISLSTQQQKTATTQVVATLKDIAQGSRQTSESVNNISTASKNLKELADELKLLMDKFVA